MRKLTKSRRNIVISGVLGGIAEYIGIDATVLRVLYIILTVGTVFAGIPIYILLLIIVPSSKSRGSQSRYNDHNRNYYDYYNGNAGKKNTHRQRKEAEKIDDDDWSDF